MPHKRGPGTYKGYQSPTTTGWPEPIRNEVRNVYGAWRVKHTGEDPRTKSRGSRIAWWAAKKKYPELYRQHLKIQKEATQELREHPWAGKRTAERIATDHILMHQKEIPRSRIQSLRRDSAGYRKAARQERAWAETAGNEQTSEHARAIKARKTGNAPLAKELEWDSKVSGKWKQRRLTRAAALDKKADKITADIDLTRRAYVTGR